MGQAGQVTEGYADKALEADIQRYNFQQNAQGDALARYMALIQGNYGSQQSSTGAQMSKGASAATGAMSGAAMGTAIAPGYGTAIGAAAGGLYGYFGR